MNLLKWAAETMAPSLSFFIQLGGKVIERRRKKNPRKRWPEWRTAFSTRLVKNSIGNFWWCIPSLISHLITSYHHAPDEFNEPNQCELRQTEPSPKPKRSKWNSVRARARVCVCCATIGPHDQKINTNAFEKRQRLYTITQRDSQLLNIQLKILSIC